MTTTISELVDWSLVAELRKTQSVTPPKVRKRNKAHYQRNRERYITASKQWRERNRERSAKYQHAYHQKHKDEARYKELRRQANRRWQAKFKQEHGVSYETFRKHRLDAGRTTTPNENTPPTLEEKTTE